MSFSFPEGVSRREFFSITALTVGSVTLADVLGESPRAAAEAEKLSLTPDMEAWLKATAAVQERREVSDQYHPTPEIENPCTQFLDNIEQVFRASPRLNTLTLNGLEGARTLGVRFDVARLAACPQLGQIQVLSMLGCFLEPDDIRALVSSPHLKRLRKLVIWMDDIGDEGAQALASFVSLPALRELSFNANRIGPAGARALASSNGLSRIEELHLMCNPIGDEGVIALANSQRLPSLTRFIFAECGIGPEGARALASSPQLSRHKELILVAERVGKRGIGMLRSRFGKTLAVEDDRGDEVDPIDVPEFRDAVANPDDDDARLDYAKWLAERDESRARFVRIQVAHEASEQYDARRPEREVMINNMLAAHGDGWMDPVWHLIPWMRGREPDETIDQYLYAQRGNRPDYRFRRGLIEHVDTNARCFSRFAWHVFQSMPSIRSARIACNLDVPGWEARFAASPHLGRLSELELAGVTPAMLEALGRSPHLSRLRTLRISAGEIEPQALLALLAPGRLPKLTALALTGCSDDVLASLAASGHLNRLTEFHLAESSLAEETAARLFASPWAELHSLSLADTYLSEGVIRPLLCSPHVPRLRSLDLTGAGLTEGDAELIAGSQSLAGLESLGLWKNGIGPSGAASLSASRHLARLKLLNVATNGVGAEGAAALATSEHLAGLLWLDLGENNLGDEGAVAVAASRTLRGLENLELNTNDIAGEGIENLARSRVLSELSVLYLSHNPLGEAGAAALAESRHLDGLRMLSISEAGLGPEGASALARTPNLPNLRVLSTHKNEMGSEGATAFARSKEREALQVLGMVMNDIDDRGAEALTRHRTLDGLIGLDLRGNDLGDDVVAQLKEAFGPHVRTDGWQSERVKPRLT